MGALCPPHLILGPRWEGRASTLVRGAPGAPLCPGPCVRNPAQGVPGGGPGGSWGAAGGTPEPAGGAGEPWGGSGGPRGGSGGLSFALALALALSCGEKGGQCGGRGGCPGGLRGLPQGQRRLRGPLGTQGVPGGLRVWGAPRTSPRWIRCSRSRSFRRSSSANSTIGRCGGMVGTPKHTGGGPQNTPTLGRHPKPSRHWGEP